MDFYVEVSLSTLISLETLSWDEEGELEIWEEEGEDERPLISTDFLDPIQM